MATAITNPLHLTPTAKGDLFLWDGASAWSKLAAGTNNYLLGADSSTASGARYFQLIAGTNMTITPGIGTLTFDAAGGGGFAWNTVSGTSQSGATNNGYACINASATTVALPTTSAVNDLFEVKSTTANTAGTTVTQAASQAIIHNGVSTTVGTGGSLAITSPGAVKLICTVANLTWETLSGVGTYNLT